MGPHLSDPVWLRRTRCDASSERRSPLTPSDDFVHFPPRRTAGTLRRRRCLGRRRERFCWSRIAALRRIHCLRSAAAGHAKVWTPPSPRSDLSHGTHRVLAYVFSKRDPRTADFLQEAEEHLLTPACLRRATPVAKASSQAEIGSGSGRKVAGLRRTKSYSLMQADGSHELSESHAFSHWPHTGSNMQRSADLIALGELRGGHSTSYAPSLRNEPRHPHPLYADSCLVETLEVSADANEPAWNEE